MFDENDVQVIKHAGPTLTFQSDAYTGAARSTVLYPGEPVKVITVYAGLFATGDPLSGSAQDMMLGIVRKEGTETATVDGDVEVITMIPGRTVLKWHMHTPGNKNTQALVDALINDFLVCDLTGTSFTIDEDATSSSTVSGLGVIGGDPAGGTLDTFVAARATFAAPTV